MYYNYLYIAYILVVIVFSYFIFLYLTPLHLDYDFDEERFIAKTGYEVNDDGEVIPKKGKQLKHLKSSTQELNIINGESEITNDDHIEESDIDFAVGEAVDISQLEQLQSDMSDNDEFLLSESGEDENRDFMTGLSKDDRLSVTYDETYGLDLDSLMMGSLKKIQKQTRLSSELDDDIPSSYSKTKPVSNSKSRLASRPKGRGKLY